MTIVILGATGQLGGHTIDALLDRGIPAADLLALGRDTERLAALAERELRTARINLDDVDASAALLAGVEKLLLISVGDPGRGLAPRGNAIEAARRAGVGHLIYTSALQAPTTILGLAAEHKATEELVTASGIPATFLRNGWYTENHQQDFTAARGAGVIANSVGVGRLATASRKDYAEAAAVVPGAARDDPAQLGLTSDHTRRPRPQGPPPTISLETCAMSSQTLPVLGVFGAGKSGVAIARLALHAGYTVKIASSGTAEDTDQLLQFVAPGATPSTARDLPGQTDVIVLAVPLRRFRALPLDALGGHIVIDVMNYWPPIDGVLPQFEDTDRPSSLIVREALPPDARLVKTFNHLGYHQMEDLPLPQGAPGRTALALAGDDPSAVESVAFIVDRLGFDPVPAGTLADSTPLEPGGPVFGTRLDAAVMRRTLGLSSPQKAA